MAASSDAPTAGTATPPRDVWLDEDNSIPVLDLSVDKAAGEEYAAECARAAAALKEYGLIILRAPNAPAAENESFLDMVEDYFNQPDEVKNVDTRPELSYQVGATPSKTERPRNHCSMIATNFKDENKPLSLCPPELDVKWRYFWRMGSQPADTKYPALNADPVVPEGFPQWAEVMDKWGGKLLQSVTTVAEMAAVGFGLPSDTFTSRMANGPHLLAPTATDMEKFGKLGTVAAGFHYDLNFMTIHGKSRYPGLYIWTRGGKRLMVRVPDGCLLVQAGKQFEYLTGGHVLAGYHEVVVNEETQAAIERRKAAGRPLWRISSTLFSHIASDVVLEPIAHFADIEGAVDKYPPIDAGKLVQEELAAIELGKTEA